MTIRIPLKTYLDSGHELVEGDTLLIPCHPYIGEFVEEKSGLFDIKMKGDAVYKKGALHTFHRDSIFIPIKIQRFHILDDEDEDIKKV